MHFQKNPTTGVVSVQGDSKMGVELTFNLRLITESVIDREGKSLEEVRKIIHESYKVTKKKLIFDYRAKNPNAAPYLEVFGHGIFLVVSVKRFSFAYNFRQL